MRTRWLVALAFIAVVAVGQEAAPDPLVGSVKDRLYTNPYLGMSLTLPKDWTNSLEWKAPKGNEDTFAQRRQMLIQHHVALWAMPEKIVMFGGQVHDTGTPNRTEFNFNTQVPEQLEVRVYPVGGAEPEKARQERLDAMHQNAKRSANADPVLAAGLSFARVDYETSGVAAYADKTVYRTALAAIRKDQVLLLSFSAGGRKDLEKRMAEVLATLHFD